jgi:hypothetical protein
VRTKCDCRVSLCLLLQDNVAVVTELKDLCFVSSYACCIAIDTIEEGAACCEPPHPVTAALFCEAVGWLTSYGRSAACDKIASAGGIPVIVQLLARLLDEEEVVYEGCSALYYLADMGSASIKSLILAQPDVIALLRVASPRLEAWGRTDYAEAALKKLGV